MTKLINAYLGTESKALRSLFARLKQLKQWNGYLRECIPGDNPLRDHCQIVNLAANVVIVIADNPHWATRFRFYVPELLVKLQQYEGLRQIKGICCKVHPGAHQQAKYIRPRPEKLSVPAAASLRDMARKISDVKLREVLERIAKRVDEVG